MSSARNSEAVAQDSNVEEFMTDHLSAELRLAAQAGQGMSMAYTVVMEHDATGLTVTSGIPALPPKKPLIVTVR